MEKGSLTGFFGANANVKIILGSNAPSFRALHLTSPLFFTMDSKEEPSHQIILDSIKFHGR